MRSHSLFLSSTSPRLPICPPSLPLHTTPLLHSLSYKIPSAARLYLPHSPPPLLASVQNPSTSPSNTSGPPRFSVLFVCLGNICRSPAAEGVFRSLVRKKGLDSSFVIDSAGTIGYHAGDPADLRMREASNRRGIQITSISRKIRPSDFRDFDLILAMDLQNRDDIMDAYERWSVKESLPNDAHKKVKLMCSFCKKNSETQVPDPYYGGPQGFEKVLDLLEDACDSLLDAILSGNI